MFRKMILAASVVGVLALGGCTTTTPSDVVGAISSATQSFTNPVKNVDIYRAKNVYLATDKLASSYRDYCWSKPYKDIIADPVMKPICQSRRATARAIKVGKDNASAALKAADKFIRNNPTGNAITYVTAAWQAVNDFKAMVPVVSQ